MTYMLKDRLLALSLKREVVPVPELGDGESVTIQELTAAQRDRFETEHLQFKDGAAKADLSNTRARLVILSVINEDGSRVFSDGELSKVAEMSGAIVDRIYDAQVRLSSLGSAGITQAKNA